MRAKLLNPDGADIAQITKYRDLLFEPRAFRDIPVRDRRFVRGNPLCELEGEPRDFKSMTYAQREIEAARLEQERADFIANAPKVPDQ